MSRLKLFSSRRYMPWFSSFRKGSLTDMKKPLDFTVRAFWRRASPPTLFITVPLEMLNTMFLSGNFVIRNLKKRRIRPSLLIRDLLPMNYLCSCSFLSILFLSSVSLIINVLISTVFPYESSPKLILCKFYSLSLLLKRFLSSAFNRSLCKYLSLMRGICSGSTISFLSCMLGRRHWVCR